MTRQTSALHLRSRTTIALCLAAALASPVWAGDTTTTDNSASSATAKSLDAVQVTGTDTIGNIAPTQGSAIATQPQTTISSLFLRKNVPPTGDYTDAISISPSVSTVAPNGPGLMEAPVVSMRGFQDGEYNVTFDGIPWGDPNDFTHHSTSYITNETTGSIVIDRGPGTASTLGNATFGGTVGVNTLTPSDHFSIEPYLSFGSWSTEVQGATFNTGRIDQTGGTTAVINVQNSDSDGYLTFAGQRRQTVFAKVEQPLGENTTLTFGGMYNNLTQYVPFGATAAQIQQHGRNYALSDDPTSQNYYRYNKDDISTYLGYLGLHSEFAGWTIDNKVYTLAYNHFGYNGEDPNGETPNGTVYGPDNVPGQRMRNWYRSWGDIFRLTKDLGPGEIHTGFWYDDQDNLRWLNEVDATLNGAPNAVPASAAVDRNMTDTLKTFQPYLEYQWNITDAGYLVGGVKYVDFKRTIDATVNQKTLDPLSYSKDWTKVLPSAALHWQFTSNWTAYVQWAKGFLAPNLNTFYTTAPQESGGLQPQQTINRQLGTNWNDDRLTLSADVYYINFNNKIESRKVGGITTFFNGGGAVYKGFEMEGSYLLGAGFSVYANGSLNRATDNSTNQWLPNAPSKTAALGVIYNQGPLYLSLIDKFVGYRYGDTGQTQPLGGYAITNFAANYAFTDMADLKEIRVGLQVSNLFDNKSINALAGYTAQLGTPLYFTIPERSYMVTFSAKF